MSTTQTLSPVQEQAVKAILALSKLTDQTGTKTTRTQNQILQNLSPVDLAAVAVALQQ